MWPMWPRGPLEIAKDIVQVRGLGCAVTAIADRDEITLVDAGARGSLQLLSGLEFDAVCFSHFRPLTPAADELVRRFVERTGQLGVATRGP